MKMIAQVEPAAEGVLKEERAHRQKLGETLNFPVIKVMTRADDKERVRILQNGQDFGAVVDFDDPKCGWSPEHILAGGFIYESAAVAEAEARAVLSWLNDSNQEPDRVAGSD